MFAAGSGKRNAWLSLWICKQYMRRFSWENNFYISLQKYHEGRGGKRREWNSSLCTLTAYCYASQAFSLTVSTKHKNTTPTIKTVLCS